MSSAALEGRKSIPGPRGAPLLGSLVALRSNPLAAFTEWTREFNPIARVRLGPKIAYLLTSPELVREAIASRAQHFERRDFFTRLRPVLGKGLLTVDGEEWRRQRRILQSLFTPNATAHYAAVIDHALDKLIIRIDAKIAQNCGVDIAAEIQRTTLDVIFGVMFSSDFSDEAAYSAFLRLNVVVGKRLWHLTEIGEWFPTAENRQFSRDRAHLKKMFAEMIESRRRQGGHTRVDLLQKLLDARDPDTKTSLSDTEIADQIMTFAFAGHDTTASSVSWALIQLAKSREIWDGARTKQGSALFCESLRLFPPAWFVPRTVKTAFRLGDVSLIPGNLVIYCPYGLHRDDRYWEQPNEFSIDRFPAAASNPAFVPFGVGPHVCIGQSLAMLEGSMIIERLLKVYRFELKDDSQPGLTLQAQVTLRPPVGVLVEVSRRKDGTLAA